jgi:hypothetical protein
MIDSIQGAEALEDKAQRLIVPEAPVAKFDSGRYVKYLGPELNRASERLITAEHWAEIGIKSDGHHLWDFRNDYMLSESLFTPAQLNYLLNVDGFFSSVEV